MIFYLFCEALKWIFITKISYSYLKKGVKNDLI